MTERACKNCHFYCPSENKGDWDRWDGECRRNPPNNGFPGVNEDFWCGEFREKGFPRDEPKRKRIETTEVTIWGNRQRLL